MRRMMMTRRMMMSFNSITRDKVMARRNLGIAMQQDIIWVSDDVMIMIV